MLALNCDNVDDRMNLENKTATERQNLIAGYDLVVIDEAQRVANIGLTIKMMVDLRMEKPQVIVTGSSSLEFAEGIYEPATGRCINYELFPLSVGELVGHTSAREEARLLNQRLVYGLYPEVVTHPADAKRRLMSLADSYLYKDLLMYKGVKKPEILQKLLRALALQVGSEVSYNELSNLLGIDKATVENYIGLLEKCYVVFRVDSYEQKSAKRNQEREKGLFLGQRHPQCRDSQLLQGPEMPTGHGDALAKTSSSASDASSIAMRQTTRNCIFGARTRKTR